MFNLESIKTYSNADQRVQLSSEIWSACTREVKTATADVSKRELLLRVTSSCINSVAMIREGTLVYEQAAAEYVLDQFPLLLLALKFW